MNIPVMKVSYTWQNNDVTANIVTQPIRKIVKVNNYHYSGQINEKVIGFSTSFLPLEFVETLSKTNFDYAKFYKVVDHNSGWQFKCVFDKFHNCRNDYLLENYIYHLEAFHLEYGNIVATPSISIKCDSEITWEEFSRIPFKYAYIPK